MDLFESKSDLKDYSFWVGISVLEMVLVNTFKLELCLSCLLQ
jgi:hypothetical protein